MKSARRKLRGCSGRELLRRLEDRAQAAENPVVLKNCGTIGQEQNDEEFEPRTEGKGAQTCRSRIRKWGHGSNVNVHVRQQPWNVLEEPVPTEGGSSYSTAIKPSPLSSRLRQMAFTSTSMACVTEGESDGDNDTPKHHAVKYDPQDRPLTAAVAISRNRPASFASAADMSMMESSGSKSEATEVDAPPHAHAKNTPTCVAGGNSSSSSYTFWEIHREFCCPRRTPPRAVGRVCDAGAVPDVQPGGATAGPQCFQKADSNIQFVSLNPAQVANKPLRSGQADGAAGRWQW
ncbi:nuclear body associated kinase [Culex quinquefasciatus]|uniref:Nuclear body associated kinase n=1 Tax=Culex quinquefasciatus TaxID=7176 RepID=B0WDZ7_CULQU|nr:nuclear body associated kinase [Culex quinquefasciatus]|eukprot:XP_001846931.1 nuclear body associated kinase [Culex quinquefasciatus]